MKICRIICGVVCLGISIVHLGTASAMESGMITTADRYMTVIDNLLGTSNHAALSDTCVGTIDIATASQAWFNTLKGKFPNQTLTIKDKTVILKTEDTGDPTEASKFSGIANGMLIKRGNPEDLIYGILEFLRKQHEALKASDETIITTVSKLTGTGLGLLSDVFNGIYVPFSVKTLANPRLSDYLNAFTSYVTSTGGIIAGNCMRIPPTSSQSEAEKIKSPDTVKFEAMKTLDQYIRDNVEDSSTNKVLTCPMSSSSSDPAMLEPTNAFYALIMAICYKGSATIITDQDTLAKIVSKAFDLDGGKKNDVIKNIECLMQLSGVSKDDLS